jgi:serine/threonine protein phosphatase PrpC
MPFRAENTPLPALPLNLPLRRRVLPNGSALQSYQYPLEDLLRLDLPAHCGLQWDVFKQLYGQPVAGEYEFLAEDAEGRLCLELFIAPDPRLAWPSLPSDRTAKGWKPDTFMDALHTPFSRMLLASRRGRAHARRGGFREDDARIAVFGSPPWQLLLVSDGAGSARYSREGSRLVCATLAEVLPALLLDHPPETAIPAALQAALLALEQQAQHWQGTFKDFYSTLLLALIRPNGTEGHELFSLQIGDGALLLTENGHSRLLAEADKGEFLNQTRFLDRETAVEPRLQRWQLPAHCQLWLMSDGVSDAFLEDESDGHDLVRHFSVEDETALLQQLDFWKTGCHDDATLVLWQAVTA